jgi:hypothetical protein
MYLLSLLMEVTKHVNFIHSIFLVYSFMLINQTVCHPQLYVKVIDINDHRPNFSQKVYSVEISENVDKGTEILRLMATDEDEDRKVFYSLHAARSPVSLSIFKIDSVTGAIVLSEKLDRYYSVIVLNTLT